MAAVLTGALTYGALQKKKKYIYDQIIHLKYFDAQFT
jgi:hypothetical protein